MKLKVTILFKGETEPKGFTCSKVQCDGDCLALEMGMWHTCAMDEIVWFTVEPEDEE